MQTKTIPTIEASDLKAARDFLTSFRDEQRREQSGRVPLEVLGAVRLRTGIARARLRSAARTSA